MRRSLFFQHRTFTAGVVAIALLVAAPLALAKEQKKVSSTNGRKRPDVAETKADLHDQQSNYLGVSIEPLHPAFAAHMPGTFGKDQGLLVIDVIHDSPADHAGIKPYDVLMTFGDQKLQSPEQLAKLVQSDKAGQEVKLNIVREGKPQEINVTIGQHSTHNASPSGQEDSARLSRSHWRMPEWLTRHPSGLNKNESADADKARWESFDSMTLKSLGKGRFKVEIGYLNKEGKTEQRTFEGTRAEIQKDIMARKDLPRNERDQLLRSLDLREDEILYDFPGV